MLGTPEALVLALGAGGAALAELAPGVAEDELLCVAVILPASPDVELGVVELEGGAALELVEAVALAVWPVGLVALVCSLGAAAALVELGALEALLDALWEPLALASGVVLGAVPELDVEALGGIAEALLSLEVVPLELLAVVGLLLPVVEPPPAVALTERCSSTFLTPATDFAISLARFLSAFDATLPVSIAV